MMANCAINYKSNMKQSTLSNNIRTELEYFVVFAQLKIIIIMTSFKKKLIFHSKNVLLSFQYADKNMVYILNIKFLC